MIERMELGGFYKELRLARKLKQSDVACEGLTASQLSKFELGQFPCYTILISQYRRKQNEKDNLTLLLVYSYSTCHC